MTTPELLAKFALSLDDLIKAARREGALRRKNAARFVERGVWKPEEAPIRIAEMEAIAGVLENLKLGQTYAPAAEPQSPKSPPAPIAAKPDAKPQGAML